jgi:hypothetical protein
VNQPFTAVSTNLFFWIYGDHHQFEPFSGSPTTLTGSRRKTIGPTSISIGRSTTNPHRPFCPPAETLDQMLGANSFAQITGPRPTVEKFRQPSPSRSRQTAGTHTYHHVRAAESRVSDQPCLRRNISPSPVRNQYETRTSTLGQDVKGKFASPVRQDEMFLNAGAGAGEQLQNSMSRNKTPHSRPSATVQHLPRCKKQPRIQRIEHTRLKGAASFPILRSKQPSSERIEHIQSPGEDLPHPQTGAQPSHPSNRYQPHQAGLAHSQQVKQSRQKHTEKVHVQRMAKSGIHGTIQVQAQTTKQPNPSHAQKLSARKGKKPHSCDGNQLRQQFSKQETYTRVNRPSPQDTEQLQFPGVKSLHSPDSNYTHVHRSKQSSTQPLEPSSHRLAEQSIPQTKGMTFGQGMNSVCSQPKIQPLPERSGHKGCHDIDQHDPEHRHRPPPLRPRPSMLSIKVHPPTPRKQQAEPVPSTELQTLSSLNVSKIPPESCHPSQHKKWIDSVNRENSVSTSDLVDAAANQNRRESIKGEVQASKQLRSCSSMGNVGTERRGSWTGLKTVARKTSGVMKWLYGPSGMPYGKK